MDGSECVGLSTRLPGSGIETVAGALGFTALSPLPPPPQALKVAATMATQTFARVKVLVLVERLEAIKLVMEALVLVG